MPGCSRSAPIIAARRLQRTQSVSYPTSAHGTNPASAHMAGMEWFRWAATRTATWIWPTCAPRPRTYAERLAAIMVTYPRRMACSRAAIRSICEIVHANGGQVYLDGANLNAQVGLVRARRLRRGCQPFQSAQDFLHSARRRRPGHGAHRRQGTSGALPALASTSSTSHRAVRASVGGTYRVGIILTIAWAYMLLMGGEGLTEATGVAILNANYIAGRLRRPLSAVVSGPEQSRRARVHHRHAAVQGTAGLRSKILPSG